jgi:hypothetical protein
MSIGQLAPPSSQPSRSPRSVPTDIWQPFRSRSRWTARHPRGGTSRPGSLIAWRLPRACCYGNLSVATARAAPGRPAGAARRHQCPRPVGPIRLRGTAGDGQPRLLAAAKHGIPQPGILATSDELTDLRDSAGAGLRSGSRPPANDGRDRDHPQVPDSAIVVQHREYRPAGDQERSWPRGLADGLWSERYATGPMRTGSGRPAQRGRSAGGVLVGSRGQWDPIP